MLNKTVFDSKVFVDEAFVGQLRHHRGYEIDAAVDYDQVVDFGSELRLLILAQFSSHSQYLIGHYLCTFSF